MMNTICNVLLKSGINKGRPCKIINCKSHRKNKKQGKFTNNGITSKLSNDIVLYHLIPMLSDIDRYHLLATNKYEYKNLAPKVELISCWKYSEIINTKFIPRNISIPRDTFKGKIVNFKKAIINAHIIYIECDELDSKFSTLSNLHTLSFGQRMNSPLNKSNLPTNLQTLELGLDFNQPIDDLPCNLQVLDIGAKFNQPIDNLPSNLKKLDLGIHFNHPVNNLPKNLQVLKLSVSFNHPIDNLPPDLQVLKFHYIRHPINNLPIKLHTLEIMELSHPISTPPNLHTLIIHYPIMTDSISISHNIKIFIYVGTKYAVSFDENNCILTKI